MRIHIYTRIFSGFLSHTHRQTHTHTLLNCTRTIWPDERQFTQKTHAQTCTNMDKHILTHHAGPLTSTSSKPNLDTHVHTHTHMHTQLQTRPVFTYEYIYRVVPYISSRSCTHTHVHTHTHMHTQLQTHTHMHTNTHRDGVFAPSSSKRNLDAYAYTQTHAHRHTDKQTTTHTHTHTHTPRRLFRPFLLRTKSRCICVHRHRLTDTDAETHI